MICEYDTQIEIYRIKYISSEIKILKQVYKTIE
jgi:hypothetical protein